MISHTLLMLYLNSVLFLYNKLHLFLENGRISLWNSHFYGSPKNIFGLKELSIRMIAAVTAFVKLLCPCLSPLSLFRFDIFATFGLDNIKIKTWNEV